MSEKSLDALLRAHLTDLQLANDPSQYLIGRVLARLMEIEDIAWFAEKAKRDHVQQVIGSVESAVTTQTVETELWRLASQKLAEWIATDYPMDPSWDENELVKIAVETVILDNSNGI